MREQTSARRGFTLIELLTVIAIIAMLAAIIFPVFSQVRNKVRESTTMSQMHDIGQALRLYHADFNRYPATLLGYGQTSTGHFQTTAGFAIPIEQLTYRPLTLGQKYLRDKDVFLNPNNQITDANLTETVRYPRLGNNNAYSDMDVTFTPYMLYSMDVIDSSLIGQPVYLYHYDSYSHGPRIYLDTDNKIVVEKDGNGQPRQELRYSLDWTGIRPGPSDNAKQLKYNNPPEDRTVVTWSTHQAALGSSEMIPVLFLSGRVRPVSAKEFLNKGPLGF